MEDLIEKGYIPYDKSWIIRMGVLDLRSKYESHPEYLEDSLDFLRKNYDELGDDLKALEKALTAWEWDHYVPVGESGTLYRFLKFASWILVAEGKLAVPKEFITEGTLVERAKNMCNDPDMINWSVEKLLEEEPKTSQRASACYLLGRTGKIENPKPKLQLTYDAVEHWNKQREKGECWEPRYDKTILGQAMAYLGREQFIPKDSEDYCFARAFSFMGSEEGERRWPSLINHESNRIKEMERVIGQTEVDSKDHRVVQAIAMLRGDSVEIKYPSCVNKSWPQFWKFLEENMNHFD